jgi:hypothetical protein
MLRVDGRGLRAPRGRNPADQQQQRRQHAIWPVGVRQQWLQETCLPSRLVRQDGTVETTAGWPSDPGPA